MNHNEVEDALGMSCGFRVTPVGNRKIEFLHYFGEGDDRMLRVKSTRPATPQECCLWDALVAVMQGIGDAAEEAKEFLPGGGGIDATKVRDSLGNPRE